MTVLFPLNYTAHPPRTEDAWYGPWTTILTSLFPPTQGYLVSPQQRLPADDQDGIPDFIFEVVKLSTAPLTFRTNLKRQLTRQTDAAFAGTAKEKVYWIGAIGPHWQYDENFDGGGAVQELIDWHNTIHDLASFNALQSLVILVSALCEFRYPHPESHLQMVLADNDMNVRYIRI
ncbi:hypothetical protein FA15DRAFT_693915 [Coprinopsis marcescibilis]|uniref:Uncharacterized protein n=1 Tax=Coprinopsis marcescibilis TaxID=230819 RepID=A0A5C3KY27_COPMA|nr:hypothetical protein FA15DRAFT_693915 [Coprinopsis marcescibilis]